MNSLSSYVFDVVSPGYFDADKVEKIYGKIILGDRKWDNPFKYKEYKAICESLSDVLNEKMERIITGVIFQVKMSFYILDALSVKDWEKAKAGLTVLIKGLGIDNDQADRIWGTWVNDAVRCIKTQDNS